MIELPVHNRQGQVVDKLSFDETCLGEFINRQLLHQALVMYEANRRQGTASTKNQRAVAGSTRKPYRQKGTGRARMGLRMRVGSRGGATCFGPHPRSFRQDMPRAAKRAATRSALLGKFRDQEVVVVDELRQSAPKTKEVFASLKALNVDCGCLVVVKEADANLWKSLRNIPATELVVLKDLNALAVLKRKRVLFTKEALQAVAAEVK